MILANCLLVLVSLLLPSSSAADLNTPSEEAIRRSLLSNNATVSAACDSIKKAATSSHVYTALDGTIEYNEYIDHYMTSSRQYPACVVYPTNENDLATALKIIGKNGVEFAVQAAGHASNAGFSSTPGIHITLKGFQQVTLSADKSSVHVGPGNIWDNVYAALEGSGVNIVGGRVTGVGVGGFITGGGGYSWKTNQHGLTSDTLLSARVVLPSGKIVTASPKQNFDLFWAIKGGGNQFGIITDFELKTNQQPAMVYGGLRTYTMDQLPALLTAIDDFANNNTDPKAQVIPTLNFVLGEAGCSLLGFYDGPVPPNGTFEAFSPDKVKPFTDGWMAQSFSALVRSAPSNATAGNRGTFNTVSLQSYSKNLLQVILNETQYYGSQSLLHSASFISYDIEPFLSYKQYATDAAWPHDTNALPLNLYYAWSSQLDDDYWHKAIVRSAKVISDAAIAEGQDLSNKYLYPNYAVTGTIPQAIYGPNIDRIKTLKRKYDPQDVMRLTTYFPF